MCLVSVEDVLFDFFNMNSMLFFNYKLDVQRQTNITFFFRPSMTTTSQSDRNNTTCRATPKSFHLVRP